MRFFVGFDWVRLGSFRLSPLSFRTLKTVPARSPQNHLVIRAGLSGGSVWSTCGGFMRRCYRRRRKLFFLLMGLALTNSMLFGGGVSIEGLTFEPPPRVTIT